MTPFPRPRRAPSRSALVAVLLLLTLGLAGMMAYQAWDAARSHRKVAEQTLKEHATFAAWVLSSTLRGELWGQFMAPGLELVGKAGGAYGKAPLPPLAVLEKASMEFGWWPGMGRLDYMFRYDLASRKLEISGPVEPGEATREWLARLVVERTEPDELGRKKTSFGMVFHGNGAQTRVVALAVEPGPEGEKPIGFGFQTVPETLVPIFQKVEEGSPLLPPALTKGKPSTDLLSFQVGTLRGKLYQSRRQYDSGYKAADTLGASYGGLQVAVNLRADVAEDLIIGGLPKSRIPTILGLLALACGLVLVAIFQLRREQELALLRTDFVSSVSHQLRTPLAQIRMFGETLLLGRVRSEEERRRSLEIIVKESQRLTHQVDNVLHFSRAQRGEVRVSPRDTHLAPLVNEVLESFCPLAEAQDCRVEASLDEALWGRVDPVALRQILLNLLENAVKYGPPDQIVDVKLRKGPPGRFRLMVEDEGEGIPEAERVEVFSPYARLERHRDSGVAGSGIGLAVVRELTQSQGGTVWVEGALGDGARFVVELPLAEFSPRPARVPAAESPAPATDPPTAAPSPGD